MREHIDGINQRRRCEDLLRAAVWSRSAEKVSKLALIHACSRSRCLPETITRADVDWAVRLGNYLTRRLLFGCREHIAENDVERAAKRVLAAIPTAGIRSHALSRKTQWLRGKERADILRDLEGCGLISATVETTGKRPAVVYKRLNKRAVDNVNKTS